MSVVVLIGAATSGKSLLLSRCRSRFTQTFQSEEWLKDDPANLAAKGLVYSSEEATNFLLRCALSQERLLLAITPSLMYCEPQWSEFLAAKNPLLVYLAVSAPELMAGLRTRTNYRLADGEHTEAYGDQELVHAYLQQCELRLQCLNYPVKYVSATELKVSANLQEELLQLLEYRLFNTDISREFSVKTSKLQISCANQFKNRVKRCVLSGAIPLPPKILNSLAWQGPADW